MSDNAASIAFDPSAPAEERTEALGALQKAHVPSASDLLPPEHLRPVIDAINAGYEEEEFRKSLQSNVVVPFPARSRERQGMQSVQLDEWQVNLQGDYWERPSALGFDSLRMMVEQTPVLNAVVMTRVRQVQRFCRVSEKATDAPGFEIRHMDKSHQLSSSEGDSIELLNRFMMNCGWEFSPRKRKALKRDSFSQFMAKLTRDSLTMDSAGIETEWKRNKALGLDGLYAVDGATIRLCAEAGYQGADEIFALQVVQGRISTPYTYEDLIYEPRNPRTDVRVSGYGLPETELLIRVVTGFLNAMSYNIKGFDNNAIPKGMLHLTGNYGEQDLAAFKRYWNSMVKGVNNQWTLPVMVSKDQESKASFEKFGVDYDEMYFSKWMTFLTSIICAIYGMSPAEINFDSFTSGNTSALGGSDTAEKLAASKDSGLRPLLSYFENLFTDYVIGEFSDKYAFRWTGLDPQDQSQKFEMRKLITTVNEARAEDGYEPMKGPLGDAPLNPQLMAVWQQISGIGQPEPAEGDFGDPNAEGGAAPGEEEEPAQPEATEQSAPASAEPVDGDGTENADDPERGVDEVTGSGDDLDFGKALNGVYVLQ
jgi:hypothetical protein